MKYKGDMGDAFKSLRDFAWKSIVLSITYETFSKFNNSLGVVVYDSVWNSDRRLVMRSYRTQKTNKKQQQELLKELKK